MPGTQKGKEEKKSTLSSKVAKMASSEANNELAVILASEMEKQRVNLREDMAALIQSSLAPIQSSLTVFQETVDTLDRRVTSVETTAGENFEALGKAEKAIAQLQTLNAKLLDRIEDLENRSRRANLRIINVPEDSEKNEDMLTFVSALLSETMGEQVFAGPPVLDRAHRALRQKPEKGPPRAIIVAFHRYQDREKALSWARQKAVKYKGNTLRFYPDLSVALSKKRAAFKSVKADLYKKGIKFKLKYPARLEVTHRGKSLTFETPPEAEAFCAQLTESVGAVAEEED
ncbi:hypothetical protein NFI96_005495 [Prochilodus magdalenae]|nr:hypothetical protein NFI96_005495 [Prochilodus magdalenae]